jgi:response regulator of citrate/malate metabolism
MSQSQDRLAATIDFLQTPHTAKDLAEHLGVSRPTAYAYIRAARARKGAKLRQGVKGPVSSTFQVRVK